MRPIRGKSDGPTSSPRLGDTSPVTADVMVKAETSEVIVDAETVHGESGTYQEALGVQHVPRTILAATTTGVSFTIVESSNGDGLGACRLLSQKYNPRTHSRGLQLVRNISQFKVSRVGDVLTGLVRWEALVAMSSRDHKEVLSEKLHWIG